MTEIKWKLFSNLRLQELEQKMVGGELANNEEVKERRRKKKKHAEERTRKLQGHPLTLLTIQDCSLIKYSKRIHFQTCFWRFFILICSTLFLEALLRKDGDEIMIDIYESVHDKLRAVNKKLESEMSKVCVSKVLSDFKPNIYNQRRRRGWKEKRW